MVASEKIHISGAGISAAISPFGAELRSLRVGERELLWQADPAFWDQTSPLLFPICGRAIDNRVAVDGQIFPMTIHGFAMKSPFTLLAAEAGSCRFELGPSAESRAAYPFGFQLVQDYRISGRALICTTRITNADNRPMPFSFGYHPGFALPLPGLEGQPHAVRLANRAGPLIAEQEANFLTGRSLPSPFREGWLEVVDETFRPSSSIIIAEGAGEALFYGTPGVAGLQISWSGLTNLVLWRPQGAGFLCVEPWQGLPSQIGRGAELAARPFSMTLAPGESRDFSLRIDTAGI